MRWDYLFSAQILERGKEYFQNGNVKKMTHRGATYQADVVGTRTYKVVVYLTDRVHPRLSCDCLYAEDGRLCKHMAAVLCAIEAEEDSAGKQTGENGKQKEKPKRIYPFSRKRKASAAGGTTPAVNGEMAEEYEYFSLREMTRGFLIYEDSFQAAQRMVEDGTLVLGQLEVGYPNRMGANELMGIAYGVVPPKGAVKGQVCTEAVKICFNKDKILSAECRIQNCGCSYYDYKEKYGYRFYVGDEEKKLCKHILGVLLLLQEKLREEEIGDATDSYAQQMLLDFRNLRAWASTEEEPDRVTGIVALEPVLEQGYEGLKVGFRAGTNKMYMVKNLSEFVKVVEAKEHLKLGTKSEIDFSTARFAEASEKFYRYIRQIIKEEWGRGEYSREAYGFYDGSAEAIKGKIALYGRRLDDFFELANGGSYVLSDRTGRKTQKTTLQFQDMEPDIQLVLTREMDDKGVFQGVRIKGSIPEMVSGLNYQYFFSENTLNRVRPEKLEGLQPFLETAEEGQISMQIGRRYLSEFYYRVLPLLKDYATVTEKDTQTIQKYLPPEAEFLFYLDAEEKNITCRVGAKYGDVECDITDWLVEEAKKERFRDEEREREVLDFVRQLFPETDVEKRLLHCGGDVDKMYAVLESGISQLMRFGEVRTTDRFRRMRIRRTAPVTVGVSVGSDIMNLEIHSEELTQEELLDILYHYRRKKKYYRLKNGDFLNLEEQSLEELSSMLEAMRVSPKEFVKGKMQLPLYRALYLDKMLEQCDGIYADRDSHFKKLVKNFKTVEDSEYELPQTLRPVMRKYQKHGYRWLRTLESCGFGGILADDMGLGKTLQVIAVLLAAKSEGRDRDAAGQKQPALIVTPASLVYNWQEEFAQFAPELSVGVIAGGQTQRRELLDRYREWDVLVTSYDLLKRDIADYEGKQFSYQVIDEAQYIKNHSTAAAKSVKIIQSRVKYALTGTPIENRLSELWSIFDYLMPGFLYGYETFKKELETPIVKNKEEEATVRLKRMVSPFILRRLKGDVLKDLPEKMEETYYAKMEEKQQRLYDGQIVHMKRLLEKQTEENYKKNKLQVLAELTKLRQICCDPSLFFEDYDGESAKRETCMELIQSAIEGEHKILLFSQFTSMLELLEKDLGERNISYYKITGETAKEKRVELVRRFNEDDTPLFLISLKAGGTGLNLTGADIVIHYDPWWNLAVQNQATDRAHRIGQTKVVSVYKLIVKDSIEEKILHMQEEKKNLADEILSGENGGIVSMSREELLELLG